MDRSAESIGNNLIRDTEKSTEDAHEGISSRRTSRNLGEKPEIENIEIAIFLERIAILFDRVIKKLEIAAAILPYVPDIQQLKNILSEAEMRTVIEAYNCQDDKRPILIRSKSEITNESFAETVDNSNEVSSCSSIIERSKIFAALEILNKYPAIRQIVETSLKTISPQSHLFLQHMKYFIEHCFLRIRLTPLREKLRERRYRKMWHENHQAQPDIAALVKFLEDQRSTHHDLMKEIDSQYQKYFRTVERIEKKCAQDIKATINRSERNQVSEYKESEKRQKDLKQYLVIANNKVENLRETNFRMEQQLLSTRLRLSLQLSGISGKLGADMSEYREVLDDLNKEYEQDKAQKEKLQEEMKIQFEEYETIRLERERKNLAIFHEQLDRIMRNRAVKLIQNWWRTVRKRFKRKKKNKKAKKGKKK